MRWVMLNAGSSFVVSLWEGAPFYWLAHKRYDFENLRLKFRTPILR